MNARARTTMLETERGLAVQRQQAAALVGDAARCGEPATVAGRPWSCVMPPHHSGQPAVDECRRRAGKTVHADRHYFLPTDPGGPTDADQQPGRRLMGRHVPTPEAQACIDALEAEGYKVVRAATYAGLQRRLEIARTMQAVYQEEAEHAREYSHHAWDEERRLADRLNQVCIAAASLGVGITQINDALAHSGDPVMLRGLVSQARTWVLNCVDPQAVGADVKRDMLDRLAAGAAPPKRRADLPYERTHLPTCVQAALGWMCGEGCPVA